MREVSLAAVLLAALVPAAHAAARRACLDAYKPAYLEEWRLSEPAWGKACAADREPAEILRSGQAASIRSCMKLFRKAVKAEKVTAQTVKALCAQGARGRDRLSEMTGIAVRKKPKPAPKKIVAAGPGASAGMGPLVRALQIARSRWHGDACWSGMLYEWIEDQWIPPYEYDKQRKDLAYKPLPEPTSMDCYTYFFAAASAKGHGFRVTFCDHMDAAFCSSIRRLEGPKESDDFPAYDGMKECMTDINADLEAAVKIARKNGIGDSTRLSAILGTYPKGYFKRGQCRIGSGIGGERCGDVWPRGKMRRVEGRPTWAVAMRGRTAFVDARKGWLRHLGPGEFKPMNLKHAGITAMTCPITNWGDK